jgi:hypothetical protein
MRNEENEKRAFSLSLDHLRNRPSMAGKSLRNGGFSMGKNGGFFFMGKSWETQWETQPTYR